MNVYHVQYGPRLITLRGNHAYYKWLYAHRECVIDDIRLSGHSLTSHCKAIDIENAIRLHGGVV